MGSPENAFYRHNRGLIPVCSAQMSREGFAFPNFGLVTYGSLPVSISLDYALLPPSGGGNNQIAAWLTNVESTSSLTMVADLSSALLGANIGIQSGDILHVLAYIYSFDAIDFAPSYALSEPPYVIHYSVRISTTTPVTLEDAMYAIDWKIGTDASGRQIIGAWPKGSYFPDPAEDDQRGCFFTMFVERPTNPRYSRFSRSRFVTQQVERFYLYPMAVGSGNVGRAFAATWQNV